jgi:hypothetical protein
VFGWRGQGGTQTKSRDSLAGETAYPNTCSAEEGNWGANKYDEFEPERQQKLELVFGQKGGEAQTPESVVPPRRAQTEHLWLKYTCANGRSCHKGADISNGQHLMAVS